MAEIAIAVINIFGGVVRTTNTLAKSIKDFGNRLHIANENPTEWIVLEEAYRSLAEDLPIYKSAIQGALSSDGFLSPTDNLELKRRVQDLQVIMSTTQDKLLRMEKRFGQDETTQLPSNDSTDVGTSSTTPASQETHSEQVNSAKMISNSTGRSWMSRGEKRAPPGKPDHKNKRIRKKADAIVHANRDQEALTQLKEKKEEAHTKLTEISKLVEEKYGIFRTHFDRFQSPHFKDICINYNHNTHESKLKQAITSTNPETNPASSSSQPVSVCVQGQGGMGKTTALRHICTAPGVKEQYLDGIHFMTIGEDAQPQHIIKSISKCIENSGFKAVASKIREAEKVEDATKMGSSIFRDRNVLLIVDDWHPPNSKHLESFEGMLSESKKGILLISTRYPTISDKCTRKVLFEPLSPTELTAKSILLQHVFHIDTNLNPNADTALALDRILEICGGIKLLLAMAGRGIRVQRPKNSSVAVRIKRYLERLILNEPKHVSRRDVEKYDKSYKQVILTNLKYCDEEVEEHGIKWKYEGREVTITKAEHLFKGFCVVEKQQLVSLPMTCRLWRTEKIVTEEVLAKLEDCCLLSIYHEKRGNATSSLEEQKEEMSIELHDTVVDVARCIASEESKAEDSLDPGPSSLSRWHEWLLGGYLSDLGEKSFQEQRREENDNNPSEPIGDAAKLSERICRPTWWSLDTEEEYFVQNVTRHLKEGQMLNELRELLSNVEWTLKRIQIGGWAALESDFSRLEELTIMCVNEWNERLSGATKKEVEVKGIGILRDILRTSWGRICENPHSLGFEVFGRIPNEDRQREIVDGYMKSIEEWGPKPWLRPVTASLRQWDGREVKHIAIRGHLRNVCYTEEGKITVIALIDNEVFVYSDALKQEDPVIIQKSADHGLIWITAFCSKTNYVACGLSNGEIHIHDAKSTALVGHRLTGHEDGVRCVALSNDGRRVVSGSDDQTVRVWDVESSEQVGHPMTGHEDGVTCVAFSNDGRRVVSGSVDETVRVWDVESSKQVGHPMTGHEDWVECVGLSDDGRRVVSGSLDNTVRVWDVGSSEQVGQPMTGHEDEVWCVALSADGRRVMSGSLDKTVRVWDVESCEQVGHPMTGHEDGVKCVALSNDGRRVVSGSRDKTVRVWDVESSEQVVSRMTRHENWVSCVGLSDDGRLVVSGSADNTVRVWDVESGEQVGHPMTGHEDEVWCVALNDDGRRVVSGSRDKTVRLWDVESGEQVGHPMTGHCGGVSCFELSEDGRRIVSGSLDKTVRVWDVETALEIGSFLNLSEFQEYKQKKMGESANQNYTEWLHQFADELLQNQSEQERRLSLRSVHQQVSKVTSRFGLHFNLSGANLSNDCAVDDSTDVDTNNWNALYVNKESVRIGVAENRIDKVAALPMEVRCYGHRAKTTVHGCRDGRVVICKLEE